MKEKDLEKIRTQMISQMRRGVLELCILSIVSNKEAYPSDIITELKDSELIVKEGTLYPLLSRLKNQGLLQYNWKESTKGPPRKYYSITEPGRTFLGHLMETWDSLVEAVNQSTKNITTNE
jgi:PadR family transcriptional regulator PadR